MDRFVCTVKLVYAVTSIKQSPVLTLRLLPTTIVVFGCHLFTVVAMGWAGSIFMRSRQ
jgi:hypothetical protein